MKFLLFLVSAGAEWTSGFQKTAQYISTHAVTWENTNGERMVSEAKKFGREDWWNIFKSVIILGSTVAENMDDAAAAAFGRDTGIADIVLAKEDDIRLNLLLDGNFLRGVKVPMSASELKYVQLTRAPMWALDRLVPEIKNNPDIFKIITREQMIRRVLASANEKSKK